MKVFLAKESNVSVRLMKEVYISTLTELAQTDERIVSLDSDLVAAIGTEFSQVFPERAIDCGIQEANMIGIAAGLSARGKIPFAHTFSAFASRRCLDQIYVSVAYSGLNVRVMASDPGIFSTYNGGTHTTFMDMAIMTAIPGCVAVDVADATMLKSIMKQSLGMHGLIYIRFPRVAVKDIYLEGTEFKIGNGIVLKDGCDLTIITSGALLLSEALEAAGVLEKEGISSKVVDMFTWKPLDEELIISCARDTGAVVVAENHSTVNGLGSAVCNVLAQKFMVPVEKVSLPDVHGEVGDLDELREKFKMKSRYIVEKSIKVLERKGKHYEGSVLSDKF